MSTKLSPSPEPLRLELKASCALRIALIALALGAGTAIFYSAIAWWMRGCCALLLLVHLGLLLRRYAQPAGCLIWRDSGWLWIDGDGVEKVLYLQHATIWPSFILLRFRAAKSGRQIIFPLLYDSIADTIPASAQRRLRMYLRHMPVFEQTAE